MITPIRINSSNNNNYYHNQPQNINHRGGFKVLNKINPIARYTTNYFTKMAKISTQKFQPIIPALTGNIKNVTIKSDKLDLNAWDINPKNSDKYILFLHGMAQNVSDYQDFYNAIVKQGKYGILALEYRSYGKNPVGKPSEENLIKDSKNALKFLIRNKNIPSENIIIAGHSMGGSLATSVASKQDNLKGLLLICPLTKTNYLGEKFSQNTILGMGIPKKVQKLTSKIRPLKWLYSLFFNSIDKIKKITCPIYLIHSKNDTVTSLQGAYNLVKAANRNKVPIEYHYPPGGGHKVDKRKIEIITQILENIK